MLQQKQQINNSQMNHHRQSQVKSFRLTTNKKMSLRSDPDDQQNSISSIKSSFSNEYYSLTKRLKLKSNNYFNYNAMGSTGSSFCQNSSFRIRTESSFSKGLNEPSDRTFSFIPLDQRVRREFGQSMSFRDVTDQVKKPIKLHLKNYKKHLKIQKPSIYSNLDLGQAQNSPQSKKTTIKQNPPTISKHSSVERVQLLENCQFLWNLRKQLCNKKINPKHTIKAVKSYVLRKQAKKQNNAGLESLFSLPEQQKYFKELIAYERAFIIGIIELTRIEKLHCVSIELVSIINQIIGFYKYLIRVLFESVSFKFFQNNFKGYEALKSEIQAQKIQEKHSMQSVLFFLSSRLHSSYRFCSPLYRQIKQIIANAKNISINRTFYDLLTVLAIYLNEVQNQSSDGQSWRKLFANFMTCPSPYIIQERKNRKYTLVLDLDETLISTKMDKNLSDKGYNIQYRPHCKQFIIKMAQLYEIVIFTSSISSYAKEVVSKFSPWISHLLCRQFTIRQKGQTTKDLSKLGRSLTTTIIVDNMAENFQFQNENGIAIKSWHGDKSDVELLRLQFMLEKLLEGSPSDIRKPLQILLNQPKIII